MSSTNIQIFLSDTIIMLKTILFFISFSSHLFAQEVSQEQYNQIRKVSQKILSKCPKKNCVFIGVGRSPTPFITFLKLRGIPAYNLPFSGKIPPPQSVVENIFFKHFDKFLADALNEQKPKFILIDYTVSGTGLGRASEYLKLWSKDRNLAISFESIALIRKPNFNSISEVKKASKAKITIMLGEKEQELADAIHSSDWDEAAEFEGYDQFKNFREPKKTEKHDLFKNLINKFIQNDPKLRPINKSVRPQNCLARFFNKILRRS